MNSTSGRPEREIDLQETAVYGPIDSRRLGRSLGINLLPADCKYCVFDCVYCQYGVTKPGHEGGKIKKGPELLAEIRKAFEHHRAQRTAIDCLTIAGNGEPTVHPDFPAIVDGLRKLRDEFFPGVKIGILSNAAQVHRPEIRGALDKLDRRYMKLDAGTAELVTQINRPHGAFDFDRMIDGLRALQSVVIQSLFIQGRCDNTGAEDVERWIDQIAVIRPLEVHVYTIDRKPAEAGLERVETKQLREI
ncbi:MAG: radical SAM protein, partial [Candidatus Omnitrophica bacterium]|nr:radical SAM protein [Candidatus Omnitrophota bacterium]